MTSHRALIQGMAESKLQSDSKVKNRLRWMKHMALAQDTSSKCGMMKESTNHGRVAMGNL